MQTLQSHRVAYTGAAVTGGAHGVSLSKAPSNFQSVRITGPNGYSSVSSGPIKQSADGSPLADGFYSYELVATQCVSLSFAEIDNAMRDNAANGRDANAQPSGCRDVVVDSGALLLAMALPAWPPAASGYK